MGRPIAKIKFVKILLLGIMSFTVIGLIMVGVDGPKKAVDSGSIKAQQHSLFHMTGIKGSDSHEGRVEKTFQIQSITIEPKQFFVFQIGRIYQFKIESLSFELFIQNEENPSFEVLDFLHFLDIHSLADTKNQQGKAPNIIITEASINEFKLKITSSERLKSIITAAYAKIRIKDKNLTLYNATVEDILRHEIIHCKKAELSQNGILKIPGNYFMASPQGMKKGSGLEKQLFLNIS